MHQANHIPPKSTTLNQLTMYQESNTTKTKSIQYKPAIKNKHQQAKQKYPTHHKHKTTSAF